MRRPEFRVREKESAVLLPAHRIPSMHTSALNGTVKMRGKREKKGQNLSDGEGYFMKTKF